MGALVMQMMLCETRAQLQQMATRAQRQVMTTTSFRTEVIRSVDDWQEVTSEVIHFFRHLQLLERKSHWQRTSPRVLKVETTLTKRMPQCLESDPILISQPCESSWSTTLRIIHTAHGAGIAREAAGPRDLNGRGRKKTESSARGECRP